jgi:hypothetical protein
MHPEAEGDSGSVCAPQLDTTRELATVAHRAGIGHGGPAGGWPLRVPFTGMLTGFGSSYPAIRARSTSSPAGRGIAP